MLSFWRLPKFDGDCPRIKVDESLWWQPNRIKILRPFTDPLRYVDEKINLIGITHPLMEHCGLQQHLISKVVVKHRRKTAEPEHSRDARFSMAFFWNQSRRARTSILNFSRQLEGCGKSGFPNDEILYWKPLTESVTSFLMLCGTTKALESLPQIVTITLLLYCTYYFQNILIWWHQKSNDFQ